jgi:hypothetical protein
MSDLAIPVGLKQSSLFSELRSRTYLNRPIDIVWGSFEAPAPNNPSTGE